MSDNTENVSPKFCPYCGKQHLVNETSVFFEYGEYDGNEYEDEGYIAVWKCSDCGLLFGDIQELNTNEVRT